MSQLILDPNTQLVTIEDSDPTISVLWDRAVQQAVINTAVGPTVASRAYSMVHTAMYDAWATFDPVAVPTQLDRDLQVPEADITESNKQEAMSYAAYGVLVDLFPEQQSIFDLLMSDLGYDISDRTIDASLPSGIGNLAAQTLLSFRHQDNSNQLGDNPAGTIGVGYSDITDYQPSNSAENIINSELWTPEYVPVDDPTGEIQEFLTPHWGEVTSFALDSGGEFRPPAPEPFLLVSGEVDLESQTITLEDNSVLEIDRDLIGTIINPEFIAQAEDLITTSANLSDEEKLIAEFWEDGGGTSFPPGTWMTFGQYVSARDNLSLDDDAKLFFALGNGVFDAGIATWEAKSYYDYARPVRAIRELGKLGLIGEYDSNLGGYVIDAWQPQHGTQTILAEDFLTYQTPGSHVSPPFAEYTSGHSAFSAAGAAILQQFTGSDDFGASVTFEPGESRFEQNITPAESVTLEWDTFSEASDEAGLSRIYGGIHFDDGDLNGRVLGTEVGNAVYAEAQRYINGEIPELDTPIYRLQHQVTTGAYMYMGDREKSQTDAESNSDVLDEGVAFHVSSEVNEDLIPIYRFQSTINPECYLLVGENERTEIVSNPDFSNAFREENLAFHVYQGASGNGEDIYRFRSLTLEGNYIYVTSTERDRILADYEDTFVLEGVAFATEI